MGNPSHEAQKAFSNEVIESSGFGCLPGSVIVYSHPSCTSPLKPGKLEHGLPKDWKIVTELENTKRQPEPYQAVIFIFSCCCPQFPGSNLELGPAEKGGPLLKTKSKIYSCMCASKV